ncbi:hypothetical protein CNMCM8980_002953 [Aspergillus fumigatiaffinis]|nr:hypothetical protein CNMCM8980_002953 [Aspergillus fumigatiaffinis]
MTTPGFSVDTKPGHEHGRYPGLGELLRRQIFTCGSTIAIEDREHVLTYTELHTKALALACQIHNLDPADTSPIGITVPRSIDHVLCQVAIIYSGRTCLPLNDRLPDNHLEAMIDNAGSNLIITDTTQLHRLSSRNRIVIDHHTLTGIRDKSFIPTWRDPQSCCHIFHTSGTTGKPKAVEARAEGLINLCLDPIDLVRSGQRLGHGANVIFDLSALEIWAALLRGATIVIIPQATLLDPTLLGKFIKTKSIDVLALTTSLLTVTAYAFPGAFSTIDTLITGGEAINCQAIRSIFEAGAPRRIINGYGPTECSVFSQLHVVSYDEALRGEVPIGKPPGNVEVFIVGEDLSPVQPGEVGELLISGVGVAGGYIGDPHKTAKSFLSLPHLHRSVYQGTGKVYRTGDLVRANRQGIHYYVGRRDNQVKIRGHRVELEALEAALLQTALVRAAVVIKITPQDADKGQFLLAYCIPTSSNVTGAAVIKAYMEQAPHLIVPRVELVDSIPINATGKADRKLLEEQYFQSLKQLRRKTAQPPESKGSVSRELEHIWIDVLGLAIDHVTPTDDFDAMGGTSLMAATMIARINKAFSISLRARMLYENTKFEKLTQLVTHVRSEGDSLELQAEEDGWWQDSRLGQGLQPLVGTIPHWQDPTEGQIFLTGATGFIGVTLLANILQRPGVTNVACLVRAQHEASAKSRIQKTLAQYSLVADLNRVIALPGNFSQPRLGLSDTQYDYYAKWASVIFHLGAKVNYVAPYSSHREANVVGTINMLKFANHKRPKAMHFTSTIAAYGPTGYVTGAKLLREDERPAPHLAALSYDTGYSQSQYVAESIIWNAIDNGFPIAIYRPGFVLGHSKTGICNPKDFVSCLYNSCMDMGLYPLLPGQRKEFVPVDFIVNAMLHISISHKNLGHAYNLIHPDVKNAIDINTCFELLNRLCPYPMRGVPYKDWAHSLSTRLDDPLQAFTPMLIEKVHGEKTRWEVYENMAEYGRENLLRALRDAPDILNCDSIELLFRQSLKSWLPAARCPNQL